jgi:hypothetical protein
MEVKTFFFQIQSSIAFLKVIFVTQKNKEEEEGGIDTVSFRNLDLR